MKKTTQKIFISLAILHAAIFSVGVVSAQSYGDVSDTFFQSVDSGTVYSNFDPSTPVNYDNVSNTNFYDASTDYGNTTCIGCSTVGYDNLSNTNYSDASTYYGNTTCVGCSTPTTVSNNVINSNPSTFTSTFIPATYSNTDTFTSTYIPATYAPTTYGVSGYSYPTYTSINYGNTGNYGYSNYGYVGNYGYSTGGYTNNTTSCPSGSTLTNGTCVINTTSCPSGSTLVNGTCTVNTTSCPSGSTLINGVCTVTNTNTTTNYVCSNGFVVTNSSQCPVTYTNSTYTYPTTNYSYQTQYKTCGDGSYIPVNQACYYANQNVTLYPQVIAPPVVKTNNVVTSIATQITNTSGRCNGIGLIANGVSSNGWFEYGETSNLGRTTASTDIGRSVSAPFSNLLAGLKPSTKYYCRAVMQNQYGVVKGEIVSFITNRTSVAYVQPTVKSKYVAPAKVVPVNER